MFLLDVLHVSCTINSCVEFAALCHLLNVRSKLLRIKRLLQLIELRTLIGSQIGKVDSLIDPKKISFFEGGAQRKHLVLELQQEVSRKGLQNKMGIRKTITDSILKNRLHKEGGGRGNTFFFNMFYTV